MNKQEEHEHGAIMQENKNNRKEQKKVNEGVVQLDEIRVKYSEKVTMENKLKCNIWQTCKQRKKKKNELTNNK